MGLTSFIIGIITSEKAGHSALARGMGGASATSCQETFLPPTPPAIVKLASSTFSSIETWIVGIAAPTGVSCAPHRVFVSGRKSKQTAQAG